MLAYDEKSTHTAASVGAVSNTSDCVPQHYLFDIAQSDCVTEKSAGEVGAL